MVDIEEKAVQTYQNNIAFFKKNHKELSEKLDIFEAKIEAGIYKNQYDLEYLNGYFDVKELESSHYLYNGNSQSISDTLLQRVNLLKFSDSFEGFPLYKISLEDQKNLDDRAEGFEDIFPIMNYYVEHTKMTDSMKEIKKFIFIGVGLGTHLTLIDDKIQAKEYFIIEDDIELFKLSLFTTSYDKLAKNAELYFSVADDDNTFLVEMKSFLRGTFFNNRFLKYSYFSPHSDNKIKQIQNALSTQGFAFFPYKQMLKKYIRPFEYIHDGYRTLNLYALSKNTFFRNKPILLLAAGPSLKENLTWVKENKDKFIIIAISAVLNTLYKNDIKPDIVTHIDGYEGSWPLFEGIPTHTFLKDTIIIFGSFTFSKLRTLFQKKQIFYHASGVDYFENCGSLLAPCVGSNSMFLSLLFNTSELYLLGLDLAINQKTGATHSDDYEDKAMLDLEDKDTIKQNISVTENIFPVIGNFTQKVYTTAIMHASVQAIHENINEIKKDTQVIYNLSDGAKLNDTIAKKAENVDLSKYKAFNKRYLNEELQSLFVEQSIETLSENDIIELKRKLDIVKKIKNEIDKYAQSVRYASSDKYLYDMLGIFSSIMHIGDREKDNIISVYYSYFEYVIALILDLLNTQGLKNTKHHVKKLDKFLIMGMRNINTMYGNALENFIQTRC